MKLKTFFVLQAFVTVLLFTPLISFAQIAPLCPETISGRITEFRDFICIFLDLIDTIIPVVISLSVLVFFWGLAKFVFRVGGDEGAVEEGRHIMLWGIIGLFVATSIYGILQFFYSDFIGGTLQIPPRLPYFSE